MRLFLLGAPCAGKSTLVGALRREVSHPVLDMDAEIRELNGGSWPPIAHKRELSMRVTRRAGELERVVLTYSRLDREGLDELRSRAWCIALLDLPEALMRARAIERERREGWSNIEWLPDHLENITWLRDLGAFDRVLDASAPVHVLVQDVLDLLDGAGGGRTAMP